MPNPLYNPNNNPVPNTPIRNLTDIVYRFNQFKANFNGDPKVAVNELINTGQMSQDQLNQLAPLAQQLQKLIGR